MTANDLLVLSLRMGDTLELLEFAEEVLDEMTHLEQGSIEGSSVETVPMLGNDHAGPLRAYGVYDPVDIECLVSKKSFEISGSRSGATPTES